MHDPFGLNVLLKDSVYPATNRYFAHLSMSAYFKHAPQSLQSFSHPVDSIYYACALAKTGIQALLIFLLASWISGKTNLKDPDFLLAAGLVTPLFQVAGYHLAIGLIDQAVTYAFFYAFALSLLLLFFTPLFMNWFHGHTINRWLLAALFPFAIVVAFHGPLNPAVVVLTCAFVFLAMCFNPSKSAAYGKTGMTWNKISLILFACFASVYSLYISRNNMENLWDYLPLADRYARLPYGIYQQYLTNPALPMLLAFTIYNLYQLRKTSPGIQTDKLITLLKWMMAGSILFLLALPLGGYRAYRPYILRMDSVMPVTLVLFLSYGLTTYYLLKSRKFKYKKIYAGAIFIFSLHFVLADTEIKRENTCEKASLQELAAAPVQTVLLSSDCTVLSWNKTTDPADSDVKTDLLLRWGVLKEKKHFYQK